MSGFGIFKDFKDDVRLILAQVSSFPFLDDVRQILAKMSGFGIFKDFKNGVFYERPELNEIPVYIDLYIDDCIRTRSFNDKTNLVIVYQIINNVPYELQSNIDEIELLMIWFKFDIQESEKKSVFVSNSG